MRKQRRSCFNVVAQNVGRPRRQQDVHTTLSKYSSLQQTTSGGRSTPTTGSKHFAVIQRSARRKRLTKSQRNRSSGPATNSPASQTHRTKQPPHLPN